NPEVFFDLVGRIQHDTLQMRRPRLATLNARHQFLVACYAFKLIAIFIYITDELIARTQAQVVTAQIPMPIPDESHGRWTFFNFTWQELNIAYKAARIDMHRERALAKKQLDTMTRQASALYQ